MTVPFARVVVVGGGIVGLSIAFRLMRRGARVTLIESGLPGASASKAAAGMLPPALEAFEARGAHPDLPALLIAAGVRWPDFVSELGAVGSSADAIGYRVTGTLATAADANEGERLKALAAAAAQLNESAELIDGSGARRIEPGLSTSVFCGLYFPNDALIEPPLVIAALARALVMGGVRTISGRVNALDAKSSGPLVCLEDGRIEHADAVVLATGWAGPRALAPALSALFPVKGQILTVLAGMGAPRCMLRGEGVYLAPRADGRVEIGATNEINVATLNIDASAISELRRAGSRLYPSLANAPVLASRAGIRPGSPDHAPLLGAPVAGEAIFLAAGMHRNGILLAPLAADILAGAILGESDAGSHALWLKQFSAKRFQ